MWRLAQPASTSLVDTQQFIEVVNRHADFFKAGPLQIGRAPGRLDLMGGIADYSGSLVLELPLAVATYVAVEATTEPVLEVFSPQVEAFGAEPVVRLSLAELSEWQIGQGGRAWLSDPGQHWASYPVGVWLMLRQAYALPTTQGLRLLIHSDVPPSKGVSSSAALEVATLQALIALYDLELSGREMALLCQQAENLVVGAPCGIMDQMTVACGAANSLLALRCQPAELEGNVALPAELTVWGLDSGIAHSVSGSDYTSVRVGAFMGYRLIADLAGLPVKNTDQPLKIDDPLWQGYLANIPPSLWESRFAAQLPLELKGADFLEKWAGTTDPITRLDPARLYVVREPTAHPIYENHRVRLFRALLQAHGQSDNTESFKLLGELMYQSHASYSRCGLGSAGTDRLVELVREAGLGAGLYGAKITGGGSGGTVAVLGRPEAASVVQAIARRYEAETGHAPLILNGSSPGAALFGSLRLLKV